MDGAEPSVRGPSSMMRSGMGVTPDCVMVGLGSAGISSAALIGMLPLGKRKGWGCPLPSRPVGRGVRMTKQVIRPAFGCHTSPIEQNQVVGREHGALAMRNDQNGPAFEPCVQIFPHIRFYRIVQRACRLIQYQDI